MDTSNEQKFSRQEAAISKLMGRASESVTSTSTSTTSGAVPTRGLGTKRDRKNAQSRARAAALRDRIIEIGKKPEELRTDEEKQLMSTNEQRRDRKNKRSRERSLNAKTELERIQAIPEEEKTQEQLGFLIKFTTQRDRKNEGDRLRRNRMKQNEGEGEKSSVQGNGSPKGNPPAVDAKLPFHQEQVLRPENAAFISSASHSTAHLGQQSAQYASFSPYHSMSAYELARMTQYSGVSFPPQYVPSNFQISHHQAQGSNDMPPLPSPDFKQFGQLQTSTPTGEAQGVTGNDNTEVVGI
eukprot:CAMPEP_0172425116 /NCGR_PEP_ID=MMETSP1064-20121228/30243_1 /TAXON_ID=202472 /ORGANISM="Aulacoseira subarctica , Strain CCAP 1002/5" /LENGTH=296 /DNA_ID=CAMNT_0013167751 /DNA_START=142 /DNA_END=1032 /DNA_ORIENTATION=-